MSINANLTDIEALLTTLQADVADGISVSGTVDIGNEPSVSVTNLSFQNADGDAINSTTSVKVGYIDDGSNNLVTTSTANPFPVRATVTGGTVYNIPSNQSTTGGTGPKTFTSVTYGTIANANASRLGCQIYNQGAGNLHVTLGTATTSTSVYTVKLNSGDYYEVPSNYTGLIGGIFASAGTALVTELS
jgi:hypothetical protein